MIITIAITNNFKIIPVELISEITIQNGSYIFMLLELQFVESLTRTKITKKIVCASNPFFFSHKELSREYMAKHSTIKLDTPNIKYQNIIMISKCY